MKRRSLTMHFRYTSIQKANANTVTERPSKPTEAIEPDDGVGASVVVAGAIDGGSPAPPFDGGIAALGSGLSVAAGSIANTTAER